MRPPPADVFLLLIAPPNLSTQNLNHPNSPPQQGDKSLEGCIYEIHEGEFFLQPLCLQVSNTHFQTWQANKSQLKQLVDYLFGWINI